MQWLQNWGSFFKYKDSIPHSVRFSLVYEYSCAQCSASYICSTLRSLKATVCQHKGVSCRTRYILNRPDHSLIREHCSNCENAHITIEDFKILNSANSNNDLRILESVYIYRKKPNLNDCRTAHPLYVLNWLDMLNLIFFLVECFFIRSGSRFYNFLLYFLETEEETCVSKRFKLKK